MLRSTPCLLLLRSGRATLSMGWTGARRSSCAQKFDLLLGSETAPRTQPSRFGPSQSIGLGSAGLAYGWQH